jgi:signal transduction histidine kinase
VLDLEHSARMERAINRMERLIGDLLDVSRIESGKLALRPERMDLATLCAQVAEEQETLGERPVALRLPDEPVWVRADPDRIAQVIANLLSNALKYSPPHKPVTLSLTVGDGTATVAVHDEGAGIPPEALAHLFEQFYRVPGVQVQHGSAVGLGLGLYISREIVELHGGSIAAEFPPEGGARFVVTLPVRADARAIV